MNELVYFIGNSLSNRPYLSKILFKWTEETKGEDFTKKWEEFFCQMLHATHLLSVKNLWQNIQVIVIPLTFIFSTSVLYNGDG